MVVCILIALIVHLSGRGESVQSESPPLPPPSALTADNEHKEERPSPLEKTYVSRGLPSRATGRFKTYMDYRTITNKATKQWELQQESTTDELGFRIHNDRYMVAVGSYYAKEVGVELRITLENGKTFVAVVGDLKKDRHTDTRNQFVPSNGNIVEFIVDTHKISPEARRLGDISPLGFEGRIVKIEVVD